MQDITCKVTPDIRYPGKSRLLFIDISGGQHRLGGSALAHVCTQDIPQIRGVTYGCVQVYGQLGDRSPDAAIAQLRSAFVAVQTLLEKGCGIIVNERILTQPRLASAGHDRSDGGLLITLLEMAFAGHCGLHIHLPDSSVRRSSTETRI